MHVADVLEAVRYWTETPMFNKPKPRSRPDDFGDSGSVGLKVKRLGKRCIDDYHDGDFGVYLGKHGSKHVVMTQKAIDFAPAGCEVFDDVAEMKSVWELD
jgi:hypothetical protein